MNRRQSLKALAVGSFGAATPLTTLAANPWVGNDIKVDEATEEINVNETSSVFTSSGKKDWTTLHLVAEADFLQLLAPILPENIKVVPRESLTNDELLKALVAGEGMIWIGKPDNLPAALSIGAFRVSSDNVSVKAAAGSAVPALNQIAFGEAMVYSGYLAPPREMPYHNIDEEVRADFLPLLEARDRFGELIGYPGVAMSYYAPSLAARRFSGSECFFFFFDEPHKSLNLDDWSKILVALSDRRKSGLQVLAFKTNYATCKPGERVQIRIQVTNHRPKASSMSLRISAKAPDKNEYTRVAELRRVAEGGCSTEALCDYLPEKKIGLWQIRLEILQDIDLAEKLSEIGLPELIDCREIAFIYQEDELLTKPIMTLSAGGISLDGVQGFWAGTHYYPSTSWWEWAWKDFHLLKAADDFAAIRRAGYRIVRVWIDPVIDEPVLRAIDASIWLASQHGIVLDICIFTQWVRYMGFERPNGQHVYFEYRNPLDFNIVSFSLRNLDLQRELVSILARRWKNAGNIFYNLANEVYLKDPDDSQMDPEAAEWPDIPKTNSTARDSMLFRKWAQELTDAIRLAGGNQYTVPGYMFSTLDGGDFYLGNADSPILPWHSYLPPEETGLTLQYFDSGFSNRPIILEEFGTLGWNSVKHYDADAHYALGAGAAAAMSYEWGISWLSREACYWPLPLLEASKAPKPDPRWFPPYLELGKIWSENGVGLCATPSGTGYGSIYHGTPFPAEAAVALGRLSLMGDGLQRSVSPEKVYVVVPAATLTAQDAVKKTFKSLWAKKLLFGVCQEADLAAIPSETKTLICPFPLSAAARDDIRALRDRGINILTNEKDWSSLKGLDHVSCTNGEKIDILGRRTAKGTLLTLISRGHSGPAQIKYQGSKASLTLIDFGLVHITKSGIVLMEGEGKLEIDNKLFCRSSTGRVIIASEDNNRLTRAKRIKLMVTKPGKISFEKRIANLSLSDGSGNIPGRTTAFGFSNNVIDIDDQMMKYVMHVSFYS